MKHNWQYKKLGEICEILDSQRRPVTKSDRQPGPFPYYGATGIQDYVADYIFDGEFLLVGEDGAKWGPNEKSAFSISGKSWVNNHAHVLDFSNSPALQRLVEYYLCGLDLSKIIKGAIIPKLTQKNLVSIAIPVPPREEQERIVAELDRINGVMEDCRQLLRTLDALAQSLFYDSFGDPISNPKAWPTCKVSDNFETGSGGTPSKSNANFWNSPDIPWIGSNMCQNTILHKTDGKFISNLGLQNSSAKLLLPDTLLVALVGATIGKVALLKFPTSTNQNIGFIKPNKDIANPIFMFYTLQGLYPLFIEIGNGNFKMANLSFIRNLPIILPPLELQQQFARRIEAIEAQKKAVEKTISTLQTLLDSRMDYWFN